MIPISARVSTEGVFKKLTDFPDTLDKYMTPALDAWQRETLAEAKEAAGKYDAFTTNRLAIHAEQPDKNTRVVATGTNYAFYLERGIRGNLPKMPNVMHLFTWVQLKFPGLSVKEQDRKTYQIGLKIKRYGIDPHPYMGPTADKMTPRGAQLVADAVLAAIGEMNANAYV